MQKSHFIILNLLNNLRGHPSGCPPLCGCILCVQLHGGYMNYKDKYKDPDYHKNYRKENIDEIKNKEKEYYQKNKNEKDNKQKKYDEQHKEEKKVRNKKLNIKKRHMKRRRYDSLEMWPSETCRFCGNRIIPGYNVSDEIWKIIIGKEICVCLPCFDREAQKYGIGYKLLDIFFVHWFNFK